MPDKTPDELAVERREYVSRVMNPATYGIAPGPLGTAETVGDALIRLRSGGVNIIGPECRIDFIPRNHLVSLRWAFFDRMNPAPSGPAGRQGNGTWYEQQGGGVSPAYGMLTKLAALTGLRWLLCARADDGSIPLYWNYRAGAEVRYFDGTTRPEWVETPYDLRNNSPEVLMVRGKDERSIAEQVGRMRAKGAQRAESFAKSRVIRALLGLDQKYETRQADMPFVWPTLVFVPPVDREMDRLFALKEMGLIGDLYGSAQQRRPTIDASFREAPLALPEPDDITPDPMAEITRPVERERVPLPTPQTLNLRPAPETSRSRPPWEEEGPPAPSSDIAGYKLADVVDFVAAKDWGDFLMFEDAKKSRMVSYLQSATGKADMDSFLRSVSGGAR